MSHRTLTLLVGYNEHYDRVYHTDCPCQSPPFRAYLKSHPEPTVAEVLRWTHPYTQHDSEIATWTADPHIAWSLHRQHFHDRCVVCERPTSMKLLFACRKCVCKVRQSFLCGICDTCPLESVVLPASVRLALATGHHRRCEMYPLTQPAAKKPAAKKAAAAKKPAAKKPAAPRRRA